MKFKKITAFVLSAVMALSLLAGCSASDPGTSAPVASESSDVSSSTNEKVKIGICFYSNTDSLGSQNCSILDAAAKALDVELIYEIGNFDTDSLFAAVQNLISGGCKGIVYQPVGSQTFNSKIMDECEANGVYLSLQFTYVSDEETYKRLESSPYYVGMVHQTEKENMQKLVQILHDLGRDNLGVGYATPGSWISEQRNAGTDEMIQELGMTKLAEYANSSDNNVNNVSGAVQNFLVSYPQMNGIVSGSISGGVGEAITQILASSDVDCAFAGVDTFEGMAEAFENGYCVGVAGGTAPNGLYSFACLYNQIMGTPLSNEPIVLAQPALIVTTAEEARLFDEKVCDLNVLTTQIFDEDYFKSLSKAYNPDLTVESLQEMMNAWSFDWVNERLSG